MVPHKRQKQTHESESPTQPDLSSLSSLNAVKRQRTRPRSNAFSKIWTPVPEREQEQVPKRTTSELVSMIEEPDVLSDGCLQESIQVQEGEQAEQRDDALAATQKDSMHSTNPTVAVQDQKSDIDLLALALNKTSLTTTSHLSQNTAEPRTSPSKVYRVMHTTRRLLATGFWGQKITRIEGVYNNAVDADKKVLKLLREAIAYKEDMAGKKREVKLWGKGEGSECFRWETVLEGVGGAHVKCFVEGWEAMESGKMVDI